VCGFSLTAAAQKAPDSMRGPTPILEEPKPPELGNAENKDIRRRRSYPMQPPTIPHRIDSYQVDLNTNKCLSCHSRRRTEESQAPMVSVTHYMDRQGNFLAEISPRRYFCDACHVVQMEAKPLVENTFQDVDAILQRGRPAQKSLKKK
jgi:cytochrome c-type protein NapB